MKMNVVPAITGMNESANQRGAKPSTRPVMPQCTGSLWTPRYRWFAIPARIAMSRIVAAAMSIVSGNMVGFEVANAEV